MGSFYADDLVVYGEDLNKKIIEKLFKFFTENGLTPNQAKSASF